MQINITHPLIKKIDQALEDRQERPRPHLGMSTLGHHCDRWLWLSFRWAVVEQFEGRILRLFRRGQMEESTVISDLVLGGLTIRNTGSDQMRLDMGCHVSGSVDGVIDSGVPGAPNKRHILEIKTNSKKSFDDLQKNGVEKSKPTHYAQMQCYMLASGIDRALYVAVCKDDDRLHIERLKLDKTAAQSLIERGHRIALLERLPEPCNGAAPDWYQCRFCAAHTFCHERNITQQVNCRTCAHATPTKNSRWICERHGSQEIPTQFQHDGCESHVFHPDLVPWELVNSESTETSACWIIEGKKVMNGEDGYKSAELLANLPACLSCNPVIADLRRAFNGRIIA
jgi:hypothetical protein